MKIVLLNFITFFCLLSQIYSQNNILKLEKIADSLYYDQTIQYNNSHFIEQNKLRDEILNFYKRNNKYLYNIAQLKSNASIAAYLQYQNKYDSAIVYSHKALKLYDSLRLNDNYLKGYIYKHLYHQTAYNGDWKTALGLANKTLQIFKDTLGETHKIIADIEFDIGYAISQFGDYSKVLNHYNKSKDIYIAYMGENNFDVALKYQHLAVVYGSIGFYKKELEYYKKSVSIWEFINHEDMSYLSVAYSSLFKWYMDHGNYDLAEQYLIKNESLIKKSKKQKWYNETFKGRTQIRIWENYAELYAESGNKNLSLDYNTKILNYLYSFDIFNKTNNPNNINLRAIKSWVEFKTMINLRFKASILKKNNPLLAKEIYEEIIDIKRKTKNTNEVVLEQVELSKYYSSINEFELANSILIEGLKEVKSKNAEYGIIRLKAAQANLLNSQGKYDDMHKKYFELFKIFQKDTLKIKSLKLIHYSDIKSFSNKKIISLIMSASKNYYNAYLKNEKHEFLSISHNLSILASDIFSNDHLLSDYNDKMYSMIIQINEQLLQTTILLNDNNKIESVLENIEESSSKLSWKKFLKSNQRKFVDIPINVLDKESEINSELNYYKKSISLSEVKNEDKLKLFKEKIFDLNKELDSLSLWYRNNYPSFFAQTQEKFNLNFIKNKLNSNQKIIKYVFANENVFAFIITNEKINLIKIGEKEILSKLVKKFSVSIKEIQNDSYRNIAVLLYDELVSSSKFEFKNNEELIFILDDVLNYLPFEILIDKENKFLFQNHSISYSPSLILWNEQQKIKQNKMNSLGVFAPTYSKETNLNAVKDEVTIISKLFPTDIYKGKSVSKKQFIDNANNYSILHLALHSSINSNDSDFSYLNFRINNEDDKMYITELYNMNLDAQLAVLSSCETGYGNIVKGEGVTSVSKAFTYAGVPSTIMSLWKVPDKETSQIMSSFYKYLKQGKSKIKALQLAKLDYLNSVDDEVLKHPFYWAGFVVSGNISPINNSSTTHFKIILLLFCLVSLFVFRKHLIKVF